MKTTTNAGDTTKLQARGVLAGCYRGNQEARKVLTHWLALGAEKTLCRKVAEEKLADEYAPVGEVDCPACLARAAKLSAKAAA